MTESRKRSFWGWGWADKFPEPSARRNLAQQITTMLGFPELGPDEPPSIDEVVLAAPRIEVPEALAAFCTTEHAERVAHTYGKSYRDVLRGFRRHFANAPDLVAQPRDEDEVVSLLDWASDQRVAVIPFGGGTSVVGGVEPAVEGDYRATVSLDMRGLDRVLEVDRASLLARIQAGATGPQLESQLAEHGLTLRHYPQSYEFSTLGGWIATRAGGHFATLYTHIDDLVASTRSITPRGVLQTQPLPASGAGPSPDRLMLGSEGTLGVITEAWMRVRPRPDCRSTATVCFQDWSRAVEAVRALSQSGLNPSNCRLLDSREAALNFVTDDGSHVLLLGFESPGRPLEAAMSHALKLCADYGGTSPGPVHRRGGERPGEGTSSGAWRNAFMEAPYLMNLMVSLGVIADTFETCCTWEQLDALHADVIRNVRQAMKESCGQGVITCRFTHVYPDGPAPYFTFMAPARKGAELEQWAAIKSAASETLLAHGATITHHHAVGRVHRPWYERQRPALFGEALRSVKRTLDPAGVLNPGVLLD